MNSARSNVLYAALVVLFGLFSVGRGGQDSQSFVKKTWEFKAQNGRVKINLIIVPTSMKYPSLGIQYYGEPGPSLAEEVGFLREVLHQLSAVGVDPRTLTDISMRGFAEPEVTQRVGVAALHSKAWQSSPTVVGGEERVVKDLLNSIGAYDAFNAAFEEYGLVVRVDAVEKVSVVRCMDVKISDPACTVRHNPHVPNGGNLTLGLIRKN